MVRSRLRFAAGVCVLAAGLLMGGGAVAVADPGLGGSARTAMTAPTPVQGGPTASSPVGNVTDTVRETVQDVTGTVGSGGQPGQQPSTGPTSTLARAANQASSLPPARRSPTTGAGGTDTEDQKEDAVRVPAAPNPVAAVPNVVAPVTDVVAPVTDAVAPVTDVVAPVTDVVAPVTDARAGTDVVAPVTDAVLAPVTDAVAPVTDVVAPVTDVVAPVSDVIAPGQYMPTSVAGAVVPLTQPPSDLSSFLLGIAGVAPVEDGSGGIDGAGLGAAAGVSGASQVPLVLPLAGISGRADGRQRATRVASLDVISLGGVSLLSGMAPLAPNAPFRWVRSRISRMLSRNSC